MQWADRIGRRLKLRDLHIFLAVVQHKSMVKTAAAIAVSQPVVSKAIADIERTLQVRVLDRAGRSVEPTLYGRALAKWATLAFDDLQQSVREIEFLADPTRGELRIGATEPMVGGLLPAIVDRIWRRHPRISFHVMPMPATLTQYQALRDRAVELIIGRMPSRIPTHDVETDVLFNEKLFVVVGSKSPLLRRRKATLADLMNLPWCLPPLDTIQGALMEEAFRASGLELPQTLRHDDFPANVFSPPGDRPVFGGLARFDAAIRRQAPAHSRTARRPACATVASRSRHLEAAYDQSRRATRDRLRS